MGPAERGKEEKKTVGIKWKKRKGWEDLWREIQPEFLFGRGKGGSAVWLSSKLQKGAKTEEKKEFCEPAGGGRFGARRLKSSGGCVSKRGGGGVRKEGNSCREGPEGIGQNVSWLLIAIPKLQIGM